MQRSPLHRRLSRMEQLSQEVNRAKAESRFAAPARVIRMKHVICIFAAVLLCLLSFRVSAADPSRRFVYPGNDGKLIYDRDERGNRIPDFSFCGYMGGIALPDVP